MAVRDAEEHRFHPADHREADREQHDAHGLFSHRPTSAVGNGRNATKARYTRLHVINDRSTPCQRREELVVGHPVAPQQQERQEEAEELGSHVLQVLPTGLAIAGVAVEVRGIDRHDQQGHRDREDRIGEERDAVELQTLIARSYRHRARRGGSPGELIAGFCHDWPAERPRLALPRARVPIGGTNADHGHRQRDPGLLQ